MYKKILFMALIMSQWALVNSQTISRKSVSSAGGTLTSGSYMITFNVGETVIPTLSAGSSMLAEGFEQPGEQIKTGVIPAAVCVGAVISVPFTAMDLASTNTYKVQLSDVFGNFSNPTVIGFLDGNSTSGTILSTIPINMPAGNGYKVRVVGNVPLTIGTPSAAIVLNPLPVVSIIGLKASYCKTAAPVTLVGTPAGGTFTIDGVVATVLNPSVLSNSEHLVSYTYTNSFGCTAEATQKVFTGPQGPFIPDVNFATAIRQYCPTCIDDCNYLLPPATRLLRLEVGEKNVASLVGIEGFTSLRELYSENNKLTELPANLPVNLRTLYVNGNLLTSLPSNLPNSIQFLNVQGNKLTSLPANLPSSLVHLYVYNNQLTSLPEALPASLMELHCFNNQLRRLPSNLPIGLRLLYTEKNPMTCLPAKLPTLTILRIDRNRIACIPHAINLVLDANFESIDLPICSVPCSPSLNRIQVSAFAGQSNNIGNELSWQVQNPTPNARFEVQYSFNGQDFETIGTLTAENKVTAYQFTDKTPLSNLSFYRLKINELGVSEATFSAIIKIQSPKILRGVNVYPNPVSEVLMIENEAGQTVEIVNALGQVVVKTKTTDVQTPINVANLQMGVYFVRIGEKQFKVLKQ